MSPIAIVLAGGFGLRLGELTANTPKPLLPVKGRPFLDYLVKSLADQGVNRIVLAAGFQAEQICEFARLSQAGIEIKVSVEHEPLGTGGGIVKALDTVDPEEETVLVLNGDTYSAFDLARLRAFHLDAGADVSIVLKAMTDSSRYGLVDVGRDGRIRGFREKGENVKGLINAGVYLVQRQWLENSNLPKKFSFERDFLQNNVGTRRLYGCAFPGYFIDIGIPADYERAERELPALFARS